MAKRKHLGLWVTLGIIAVLIVVLISNGISTYNTLVSLKGNVKEKQAVISTQLQRRNDLIPNLVNTVKGYANHEAQVFTDVTEARSKVAAANTVEEQAEASAQLSSQLSTLLNFTYENYPELKANQNFITLQDELAGAENRIATARNDYNEAAKEYNVKIKKFPTNIIAGMFSFDDIEYFEAEAGANEVPEVSFE